MSEILGNRYEGQENRNNENISVFDSQKYQSELQGFYMKNKDNPNSIQTLKDFIDKQDQDKSNLREKLEKPVLNETREQLDKEAVINEAKTMLYEKVGIDNNLDNNNSFENFIKGVIDGGILDNYDLAIQVYETNGKVILDGLEQLLSWEGLKNLASAIGEDILTLFTGNAYEKGKVSAEVVLVLLTAGAGLTVNVAKKGVKLGIKELSRLRVNKERLVESPEVKNVINETNTKLDEIVPKKEVDLNKEVFDKLPENVRNLNLELDNYSSQQLEGVRIRLGLDNKATIQDIDLAYRIKLQGVLERYKELSDVNLKRFESEVLANLEKVGDVNPIKTLEDEIIKLELMKDRGELLVVSAMSDEVVKSGIKFNHFANLDRVGYTSFKNREGNIVGLNTKEGKLSYIKEKNYNGLRGITDNLMGVEGLDPTYLSLVISKNDINKLSQYGDKFMVFDIDELHGRATITMNDSMLAGRFNGNSLDTQLIEYSTETLIKSKAMYNIDEKLGFPMFDRMRLEAFNENKRMTFFYQEMKPFIEVQVYGKTSDRVKESLSIDNVKQKFKN